MYVYICMYIHIPYTYIYITYIHIPYTYIMYIHIPYTYIYILRIYIYIYIYIYLFQRCESTLKMKQNVTSDFQRCTTLIQRQCPTLKECRNNADTTVFQPSVDVSSSYIESSRAIDDYGFGNTLIVFILLNDKTFFTIY